ncbi:MAG: FAD-dependent oxidoreductase [Candidatus Moraniibacteriota bacterium]|nr:MAG: FAD-dependent oxidoreductase [Candidatus Moranbacteria bacterium]
MQSINFQKKEEIAENTFIYTFSRPEKYSFEAGQYAVLRFNKELDIYPDARGNVRTFSFASAPYEEELSFLMRQSESGFKKNIHKMSLGDSLEISDPMGNCSLSNMGENVQNLVFICAGVGYSPMRSILRHIIKKEEIIPCLLINSNRTPEATPEFQWIESLSQQYSHIKVINTMTDMEHSTSLWNGRREYIDENFLRGFIEDTPETQYFIAAGANFIQVMKNNLENMGISKDRMFFDNFGSARS